MIVCVYLSVVCEIECVHVGCIAHVCTYLSFCVPSKVYLPVCAGVCVCTVCATLPEGSFKNTLCQILDDYCII